jgi:hypothetical protein
MVIHSIKDFYEIVGSLVVGWVLNNIWDWLKHSFWVGFKAGLAAQIKKGAPLTPEETAELRRKLNAQLTAEFSKKLMKIAEVADDSTPPQV